MATTFSLLAIHFQEEKAFHRGDLGPLYRYFNSNDGRFAYDPILWMGLAPLDFITLITNFWLFGNVYWRFKWNVGGVPRLMREMLRDNICYLTS